jgi:hypothetical protein
LRRELARLDKMPDSLVSTGDIKFPSPADEMRVVGELKSKASEKSFSTEELAAMKAATKA